MFRLMKFKNVMLVTIVLVAIYGTAKADWFDGFDTYGSWQPITSNWSDCLNIQTAGGSYLSIGSSNEWGNYGHAFRNPDQANNVLLAKMKVGVPSTGSGGSVWQNSISAISMSTSTICDSAGRITHAMNASSSNIILEFDGGDPAVSNDSFFSLIGYSNVGGVATTIVETTAATLAQNAWYEVMMVLDNDSDTVTAFYKQEAGIEWNEIGSVTQVNDDPSILTFEYNYVGISGVRNASITDVESTIVPEPTSICLIASGVFGLIIRKK